MLNLLSGFIVELRKAGLPNQITRTKISMQSDGVDFGVQNGSGLLAIARDKPLARVLFRHSNPTLARFALIILATKRAQSRRLHGKYDVLRINIMLAASSNIHGFLLLQDPLRQWCACWQQFRRAISRRKPH